MFRVNPVSNVHPKLTIIIWNHKHDIHKPLYKKLRRCTDTGRFYIIENCEA